MSRAIVYLMTTLITALDVSASVLFGSAGDSLITLYAHFTVINQNGTSNVETNISVPHK